VFIVLPGIHATSDFKSGRSFVPLLELRPYRVITAPFYKNGHATDDQRLLDRMNTNQAKMKADQAKANANQQDLLARMEVNTDTNQAKAAK
jgi:hypothetical protein